MRYIAIIFILTLSLSSKELNSTDVNPDFYVIQVSTVQNKSTALSILKSYSNMSTYIAVVDKYIVLYVVNLESYDEAKEKLKIVKKKYKDAYIRKLSQLTVSEPIKVQDVEIDTMTAQIIDGEVDKNASEINDEQQAKADKNLKEKLELEAQKVDLDKDELFLANRETGFTLSEAILQSLNNNYKLKASLRSVYQARYLKEEKESGHLPSVDLSANVGYEYRDSQAGDIDPDVEDASSKYKKTELFLTITENIWSGGQISANIDSKDSKLKAKLFEHRDKMESATFEIIKAYFDLVYGEIAVKVSKKNMLNYQKILDIVKIKEENGASTKGDVNFILANVDNAKSDLVNTEAKLSDAMANYEYLMQDVTIENMPFETGVLITTHDLEESINYMQENNAKILAQKAHIQASFYDMEAQDANYYPTIDFSVNAETRDEFDTGIGQRNKVNALVSLNYNLYAGGKDEAGYLRKFSRNTELKYLLEDQKAKLLYDTKVIHRSVSATESSLELTRNEVLAARKVVDSYWIAFTHGTQDLQALQLAQRNLNRSELDYMNYKKNLIINDFKLKKNTGELLTYLKIIDLIGEEYSH